jgi:hypothetical protein
MLGEEGVKFYTFLQELADFPSFKNTTQTLAYQDVEQKANEELVLRFLAAKGARAAFQGSVRNWLDNFMEGVLLNRIDFDATAERKIFTELFDEIEAKLGESAFVKFRGNSPIGGLAPAYFEAGFDRLPECACRSEGQIGRQNPQRNHYAGSERTVSRRNRARR